MAWQKRTARRYVKEPSSHGALRGYELEMKLTYDTDRTCKIRRGSARASIATTALGVGWEVVSNSGTTLQWGEKDSPD